MRLELVEFGAQRVARRALLMGEIGRDAVELAQAVVVAIWKVGRDGDPLPALGRDGLGFGLQLLGDQGLDQAHILQPAAVVLLEEVTHDDASRRLVGVNPNEQHALVGCANGLLRQHATDLIRLLAIGTLERVPDQLLAHMVGCHRERHELFERYAVLGIDVEELRRPSGEA